jgi:hypothetical protein
MIETTQPQWSQDQREAIITTIQLALARLHSQRVLDDDFVATLWPQLASQFQPSATLTTGIKKNCPYYWARLEYNEFLTVVYPGKQPDISVLSQPKDVRFQLLLDLLATILDLKTDK